MASTCKQTWLHWFQIDHFVIAKSSTCLSPKIIHDTSSLKSTKPTKIRNFHNAGSVQTISSLEQDHNACSGPPAAALHHSHIGSVMIVLCTRACFIDMALRQALHMNVFTFCCTCRPNSFPNMFVPEWWNMCCYKQFSLFFKESIP